MKAKMKFTLIQRFSTLIFLFVCITVALLYLLVSAKNEPISFGRQEKIGNYYQRPLERVLAGLVQHRILAQRQLNGETSVLSQIGEARKKVDDAIQDTIKVDAEQGAVLQFTEEGLKSRKREHFTISNVENEWNDLKNKLVSLKAQDSNDLHAHLISDVRNMITHLGDTSNLILDPDLDSYYLMDITLIALPQTHDRIQNAIVDLEGVVRRGSIGLDDRIKASVIASMMNESDLERIKADFQTVLNEDPNFFGASETLLSKLNPQHKEFVKAYEDLIQIMQTIASGTNVPTDKFIQISDRALDMSFDYWTSAVRELDTLLEKRVSTIQKSKVNSAVMSVIGLIFLLALSGLFVANISSILRGLISENNRLIEGAASGDLKLRGNSEKIYFEFRPIIEGWNKTLDTVLAPVNESAKVLSRVSNSDLSERVVGTYSGDHAAIKNDLNTAIENLNKALCQVAESVHQVSSASSEISAGSQSLAQCTNEQAASLESISANIQEITNLVRQNLENTVQANLVSKTAQEQAEVGNKAMTDLLNAMERIKSSADQTSKIIKTIDEIAFQTNLLALNAAVEAARAGESGKGFAVVAEEVRGLALRSAEAAKTTSSLIDESQMNVKNGAQATRQVADILKQIVSGSQNLTLIINEISTTANEQFRGIEQINSGLNELNKSTQQNSALSEESASSAVELNNQADGLLKLISNFKLSA